jgi:hypothetical protein
MSRERKKYYVDGLEKRVDLCTKENQLLQKQIKQLKEQNRFVYLSFLKYNFDFEISICFLISELSTKLQKMQSCLVTLLKKSNKAKLSTTILFLSFFMTFCVYPLFDSKTSITTGNSIQVVPYTGGKFNN